MSWRYTGRASLTACNGTPTPWATAWCADWSRSPPASIVERGCPVTEGYWTRVYAEAAALTKKFPRANAVNCYAVAKSMVDHLIADEILEDMAHADAQATRQD